MPLVFHFKVLYILLTFRKIIIPGMYFNFYVIYYIIRCYYFNKQFFGVSNIQTVPCTNRIKTKITTPDGEDLRRLHPSAITLPFRHHRRYTRIFRRVNTRYASF